MRRKHLEDICERSCGLSKRSDDGLVSGIWTKSHALSETEKFDKNFFTFQHK